MKHLPIVAPPGQQLRDESRGRRPHRLRSRNIAIRDFTKTDLAVERAIYDMNVEAMGGHHPPRPQTRGECIDHIGPCPFFSCRYHLAYDVDPRSGSLRVNFPGVPLEEMVETCALDVADRGGTTLQGVGAILNLTRERIRQIEVRAYARIAVSAKAEALRAHTGDAETTK